MGMPRGIAGGAAGFVATIPMTVVMVALHRMLPRGERYPLPPEEITAELMERSDLGDTADREQRWPLTLITHFGFGTVAGVGLGVVSSAIRVSPGALGTPYSLVVWLVSYLGWLPATRILLPATQHPARRNSLMIVSHVVWGIVAGAVIERLAPANDSAVSQHTRSRS